MFDLIPFLTLLVLGYFFGRRAEKKHFKSLRSREAKYRHVLTFSERLPPPNLHKVESQLVAGNVVISIDYFKQIVAGLRSLVGGRLTSYESLLERARREAILRMKEQAAVAGAESIFNVKLETASITKGQGKQVGCVEVFAYGTAIIPIT
ncbi:MAG: heavy metal-binding domain-containing protein [Pseudomonadales bacterium]|nr:heavy metal-binding domain-containing protein [Pseudomonadales bacterium]